MFVFFAVYLCFNIFGLDSLFLFSIFGKHYKVGVFQLILDRSFVSYFLHVYFGVLLVVIALYFCNLAYVFLSGDQGRHAIFVCFAIVLYTIFVRLSSGCLVGFSHCYLFHLPIIWLALLIVQCKVLSFYMFRLAIVWSTLITLNISFGQFYMFHFSDHWLMLVIQSFRDGISHFYVF